MANDRVNYGSWVLRVISWDTLLPVVIAIVPTLIRFLAPNRRGLVEIAAVILPIVAFFVRIAAGRRQIDSNHCSEFVRRLQFGVFCVGIVPLIAIDCMIILSDLMPANALVANETDRMVFEILIGFYLIAMIIAMYPGRTSRPQLDPADSYGSPNDWMTEYDETHR